MEIAARARLRPNKDEDLIEAWKRLPPHEDKSDVVRRALRLLFFGTGSSLNINELPLPFEEDTELSMQSEEEQMESSEVYDDKLDELFGSF
ncbi:hypothetical protein HUB98_05445 [Paenibacillus barcinonensis]|uniref:Uncharacterized protein n=1 Tax=Paenibacillus barcinonensis TaxID=198119 RepID=A0A2V4W802_PAEBA|nr:hypothetical protein [Paenibacillus barcinonensis]PYE51433.1 hypothetical protein DFQ00_102227 [Paenibacillus barcinonensis]QKS55826.1 hypothetical protein HUB98_05445 [Paenibacillus barcinonensis]